MATTTWQSGSRTDGQWVGLVCPPGWNFDVIIAPVSAGCGIFEALDRRALHVAVAERDGELLFLVRAGTIGAAQEALGACPVSPMTVCTRGQTVLGRRAPAWVLPPTLTGPPLAEARLVVEALTDSWRSTAL
ncbi:hypothetical protein [Longispora urticae]